MLTPLALLGLIRNVTAKMTGNLLFPNPPVTMAELGTLANRLAVAIEEATDGSKASKLYRNSVVAEVKVALQRTADHVRSVCVGNAAQLVTSGFELTKPRERIGVLEAPRNVQARTTTLRNQVELRWPRVHGANSYRVWMSDKDPAVDGTWTPVTISTRSKVLVTDLESFKAYWFCVSAFGTAGEGAQSAPAMGRAA